MKLNVFKSLLIGAFIFLLGGVSMAQANTQGKWDKVFAKSNKVEVQKVSFKNRYGITLVGVLYIPKDISNNAKHPAIALSGPFWSSQRTSFRILCTNFGRSGLYYSGI